MESWRIVESLKPWLMLSCRIQKLMNTRWMRFLRMDIKYHSQPETQTDRIEWIDFVYYCYYRNHWPKERERRDTEEPPSKVLDRLDDHHARCFAYFCAWLPLIVSPSAIVEFIIVIAKNREAMRIKSPVCPCDAAVDWIFWWTSKLWFWICAFLPCTYIYMRRLNYEVWRLLVMQTGSSEVSNPKLLNYWKT